jgi:hypothetical protein
MNVIKGPAAIRIGKYWKGCASGNIWATKLRITPERAIEDAQIIETRIRRSLAADARRVARGL